MSLGVPCDSGSLEFQNTKYPGIPGMSLATVDPLGYQGTSQESKGSIVARIGLEV